MLTKWLPWLLIYIWLELLVFHLEIEFFLKHDQTSKEGILLQWNDNPCYLSKVLILKMHKVPSAGIWSNMNLIPPYLHQHYWTCKEKWIKMHHISFQHRSEKQVDLSHKWIQRPELPRISSQVFIYSKCAPVKVWANTILTDSSPELSHGGLILRTSS